MVDLWRKEHEKAGYLQLETPIMLNKELWEISGHWFNYRENMYTSEIDEVEFAIKPMNCPGGVLAFKHQLHLSLIHIFLRFSYRLMFHSFFLYL